MRILFIILFIAFAFVSKSQECPHRFDSLTNQNVYTLVDVSPNPEGGISNLIKQVSKKIKYPNSIKRLSIETKIIVSFVINVKGQITGKRVIKDIQGTDFAEQLLNALDDIKWEAGSCNGKKVPVLLYFPMIIELG